MTQAWLNWETNLLLLLKGRTEQTKADLMETPEKSDELFDDLFADLCILYEDWLDRLYFEQYMGVQWEADMASPLFPSADRVSSLDVKVGGNTLRDRIADTVDMAQFFWDAEPGKGKGLTVFESVGQKLSEYVRTEGQRTMNEARMQATSDVVYSAADGSIYATKTWDATLDARTRETHRGLHGRTVAWDEYFWTVNGAALYPGGFGIPEEDVNCRCVLQCSINGNYKKVQNKTSFEAWLKEVMQE